WRGRLGGRRTRRSATAGRLQEFTRGETEALGFAGFGNSAPGDLRAKQDHPYHNRIPTLEHPPYLGGLRHRRVNRKRFAADDGSGARPYRLRLRRRGG